jgi:isoleucyl-tRNA synthetase
LHRLAELDALFQGALQTHDWTGIYPALHHFCATDLSAFYFDIRKDALYCDTPASPARRACRTVLDILHRTLTAWLAPALPFTAEDAWSARFGTATSVHETLFAPVPATWTHAALAAMWARLREVRGEITAAIETMRREKVIGASLQAAAIVPADAIGLLPDLGTWAELCITSAAQAGPIAGATLAQGQKCERCWRVLPEVGANAAHPTLCTRCCDAV